MSDSSEPKKLSFEEEQNIYLRKLVKDAYKVYMRLKSINEETHTKIVHTLDEAEKKLAGKHSRS